MHPATGVGFPSVTSCGEVKTGDSVQHEGQTYVVRGFTLLGSSTYVLLEHEETEDRRTVPLTKLTKG
jgi:hypothetical protein